MIDPIEYAKWLASLKIGDVLVVFTPSPVPFYDDSYHSGRVAAIDNNMIHVESKISQTEWGNTRSYHAATLKKRKKTIFIAGDEVSSGRTRLVPISDEIRLFWKKRSLGDLIKKFADKATNGNYRWQHIDLEALQKMALAIEGLGKQNQ